MAVIIDASVSTTALDKPDERTDTIAIVGINLSMVKNDISSNENKYQNLQENL